MELSSNVYFCFCDSSVSAAMFDLIVSPFQVFKWKRTRLDMTVDINEYSKSIILAGRAKDVDLAVELFSEIESDVFK